MRKVPKPLAKAILAVVAILVPLFSGAFFWWRAIAVGDFSAFWRVDLCEKKVASTEEAKHAISVFFNSDSKSAKRLIDDLRRDGLTDEYLKILQDGCSDCYLKYGEREDDPTAWYALASIAPPSPAQKIVVLKVDCEKSIVLERKLYGGY